MILPYADDDPEDYPVPWATWLLVAANVLVFVLVAGSGHVNEIIHRYGFVPARLFGPGLLTSLFLHGGWVHLLSNMWILFLLGNNVEARCQPFAFLGAYLLCGVGGNLNHAWLNAASETPCIGASGAIAGVLAMYWFFFPANRIKVFYFALFWVGTVKVRAVLLIGLWFLFETLSGLNANGGGADGIAHSAHVGGFLIGLLLAAVLLITGMVRNDGRHLLAYATGIHAEPPDRSELEREREERQKEQDEGFDVEPDRDGHYH